MAESEMAPSTVLPLLNSERLKKFSTGEIIATPVESYLLNGRPELHGRLERGFTTNVDRDRLPGSRRGLCGYAALFSIEAINDINKLLDKNIAGKALQARKIGSAFPKGEDVPSILFRTHGYTIALDKDDASWWLIDQTFNQFVEKEGEGLRMIGSNIDITPENETSPKLVVETANQLLENGHIRLSRDSLAAYIVLMSELEVPESSYEKLKELFSDDWKVFEMLGGLLNKTHATRTVEDCSVGDWSGPLNNNLPD